MVLEGTTSQGWFSTDHTMGFLCGVSGSCSFTGEFVAVPEPASLALLAGGVLGLAAAARRGGAAARRSGPSHPAMPLGGLDPGPVAPPSSKPGRGAAGGTPA
jgi:hypothetical protein